MGAGGGWGGEEGEGGTRRERVGPLEGGDSHMFPSVPSGRRSYDFSHKKLNLQNNI